MVELRLNLTVRFSFFFVQDDGHAKNAAGMRFMAENV